MATPEKAAAPRAVELDIPASAEERERMKRRPMVGAIVHYFDESRDVVYARMGKGPYAAIVTALEPTGIALFVLGPQGGRFDVDKVQHKDELTAGPHKKRWWEWPPK